jgi:hypothetical protein
VSAPGAPSVQSAPGAPGTQSPISSSTRTTLVAGVLVGLSAVLAFVDLVAVPSLLSTAGPLLALAGAVLLVVGVRGETGLGRVSAVASTGVVLLFVPDVVDQALSSLLRDLATSASLGALTLGTALSVLRLVAVGLAVAAAVVVVRRRLLEPWPRRALVAVVAAAVFFALLPLVPSSTLGLLVIVTRLYLLPPVLSLLLGVALVLHGRGGRVRSRMGRALEAWRSSADVVRR